MSEADDIMGIYSNKCSKIKIPTPEAMFEQTARQQSEGIVDRYFSATGMKSGKNPVSQSNEPQPSAQQPQQLINEKQYRNNILHEAALNLAKVLPLFTDKRDKEYVKEIREAIEELME